MLSADYSSANLLNIAQQDAAPLKNINIGTLQEHRKYLLLDVPDIKNPVQLTTRQLQCLILVVKGYNDDLAAESLQISRYTFCEHVRLVTKKLAARKRSVLIQRALAAKIWL